MSIVNFLRQTRKLVNAKEPVCIVLGNESCDLDSVVSAVALAYFYQNNQGCTLPLTNCSKFLPILNIPKRDYPLKTEVQYLLKKYSISDDFLTFKDELNEDFVNGNQFILVDHHVSPFLERCVAIYDHRPKDCAVVIPSNCKEHLHLVASCATLIAELFIQADMLSEVEKDILNLLRSTIILDTVNFSELAARATIKDYEICSALENALKVFCTLESRDELFDSLVEARADVSSLTAFQLLRKDLKVLSSFKNNVKISLPGFPILVQNFILKADAENAIREFANEFNCSVVLLMGMYVKPEDKSVHRDFGLININDFSLCETVKTRLFIIDELKLSVEPHNDCRFMEGFFCKQHNIKVTRKHILPIIKQIIQ